MRFLSTLSLRRATTCLPACFVGASISIHALLAESDNLRVVDGSKSSIISIHALLAESDFRGDHGHISGDISIHALLAESDFVNPYKLTMIFDFYPRSPCGERLA